jgi:hypothetical protein
MFEDADVDLILGESEDVVRLEGLEELWLAG